MALQGVERAGWGGERVRTLVLEKRVYGRLAWREDLSEKDYRGTSLIRTRPPPLGPPWVPRHSPTVGFQGGAFSYERGTTVSETASHCRVSSGRGGEAQDFGH